MSSKFIIVEGPDFCGKSSQLDMLQLNTWYFNKRMFFTREPGSYLPESADVCEKIRDQILNNDNSLELIEENPATEIELLERWLEEKTTTVVASKAIYERFCPICKSKDIYYERNNHNCMHCKSKYTFYKDDSGTENVWFISLGGQTWKNN